ncbi:hypothetical protein [Streptomyces sp.]|uniref:hypothetical protein n=1 Tax=Streptomyces sp. TaxID=1931 RepID=UPI002D78BBDF|nr:hypothetical protein [Streptomyces sp.]HET6352822.1 hypothetical protein [Streptomyces sp.]
MWSWIFHHGGTTIPRQRAATPYIDELVCTTLADIPPTDDTSVTVLSLGLDARPLRPGRGIDHSGLAIADTALAACAGCVLYGVFTTPGSEPEPKAAPSADVTYEVTGSGTVDISYRALGTAGNPDRTGVRLPWKKTVGVPIGKDPIVSITLDGKGGQARCALAIRSKLVQSATALGEFGRATCTGGRPGMP